MRGRVLDGEDHPIAYAAIEVPGVRRATLANATGNFELALPPGPHVLRARRMGFEPGETEIWVDPLSAPEPVLRLAPRPLRAAPIVVVAPRATPPAAPEPGSYPLDPRQIERRIGAFEDIMRVAQSQPGVGAASDLQGDFWVRGSPASANSILLDGVEIPFPYHILGFNSVFNPGLLESAELLTGGAPAEYGNATGGILALQSRGASPPPERAAVGLSYLSAQARMGLGDAQLGVFASVRRSHQDQLLRLMGSSLGRLVPVFHDAFVRARWQPASSHLLTFELLNAGDGMSLPRPEISARELDFVTADGPDRSEWLQRFGSVRDRLELRNRMWFGALYWRAGLGPTSLLETTLGDVPQDFRFSLQGDNHESVSIRARTTSLRQDLTWRPGHHRAKLGWMVSRGDAWRDVSAWAGLLTLRESNSSINLVDLKERYEFDTARRRDLAAVYAQDEWEARDGAHLGAGVRVERDGLAHETRIGPRLSAEWRSSERWSVRGTLGVHHDMRDEPMEVLPTIDGRPLGAERSLEATLGGTLTCAPGLRGGGSIYAKRLDRLVYEAAPALYATGGEGRAHGMDVWLRYEPQHGPLHGGLTYAWSRVRQRDPVAWRRQPDYHATEPDQFWVPVYEQPYWYRPVQDEPHRLGIEGFCRVRRWDLGMRYQLTAGHPYTPVEWVATDPLYMRYGIVGAKGSARYPAYQRLDVRVQRTMERGGARYVLYADVLNVTNAENVFQYRYDPEYRVRYAVKMLPVLPTLGFEVRF